MKIPLIALLAGVASIASSKAITIQTGIGFNPGVVVQDSAGVLVTTSYQFAVGTFAVEPSADSTFQAAWSSFNEFARATVAANAAGGKVVAPGNGAIAATATDANDAALYNTKNAYVFIGNAAKLEDSTAFAIIKGTPEWVFPADTLGAASMNVVISGAGAFSAVVGSEVDNATGADVVRFAVPEPTTGVFALIAALGLVSKRRRQ